MRTKKDRRFTGSEFLTYVALLCFVFSVHAAIIAHEPQVETVPLEGLPAILGCAVVASYGALIGIPIALILCGRAGVRLGIVLGAIALPLFCFSFVAIHVFCTFE